MLAVKQCLVRILEEKKASDSEWVKHTDATVSYTHLGIDNDDVWEIMEAIANKQTSGNVAGIMIIYEESEEK